MKKVLQGATALAAIMIAGPAFATDGWYGRADAGYGFDGKLDPNRGQGRGEFDSDTMADVGIGYAMGNGLRFETELGYRYNDLQTSATVRDGGNAHAWAAMLNGFFDFNKGNKLEPYVGLGVGYGRVTGHSITNVTNFFDDNDSGLAYQGMFGVGVKASERLTLDVGYRYLVVPGLDFDGRVSGVPTKYETDYEHQAITVGLRWQFAAAAAPPPPPPPAPPPPPPPPEVAPAPAPVACPTTEFKVYFEWDRSNLNQAALDTIDAAVQQARACNVSGVLVVGHTDTSGRPAYNVGLSNRRAAVVRDALIARGMAGGAITTDGKGEAELDRPTRDGVREPLNRRTVVTISFQ